MHNGTALVISLRTLANCCIDRLEAMYLEIQFYPLGDDNRQDGQKTQHLRMFYRCTI